MQAIYYNVKRDSFMRKSKTAKIIEQIAISENRSVTEIRSEMSIAIKIAYEKEDKDEFEKAFWGKWRKMPTPEEFIATASAEALARIDFKIQ